ncbi:sensor histidine kinase [Fictibacillus sp. FJAT-27399]|uniref:sensor histidine kinase n=1 Tax=Fictibacillus sp. FJAT-27399 TaxID=1729689 RepID=UPI000783004F|nr:histidine kinase [Fictibacillus sp. FJAT-27399]
MTYKQIKWLILMLPTVSIGIWEYLRHTLLMPYISMETGNFLSPLIVFGVTIIFLLKLFNMLEKIQAELNEERSQKGALQERAKISRELHDGIAQSLFLLSIKINKIGKQANLDNNPHFIKMKKTLQHIHEDTRQAINNLRVPPVESNFNWTDTLLNHIQSMEKEHQFKVQMTWEIGESLFSTKDKVELYACIKEALINVVKHARTNQVWIDAHETKTGWTCIIKNKTDQQSLVNSHKGYGLQILKDRAKAMGSDLSIHVQDGEMLIAFVKEI